MIGGLTGLPRVMFHRAGQPDADPGKVFKAAARFGEEFPPCRHHPAEHHVGAVCDFLGEASLGEDCSAEIGDGDDHVRRADVDRQDNAGRRVEGKARRRPAATGTRLTGGAHESGVHEGVDARGDGGTGQPGGEGELGPGPCVAVAKKLKQISCTRKAPGVLCGAVLSGVFSGC